MTTSYIEFDNFDAGEFSRQAPWKAPRNSFTGLNVVPYVDGSIGPRNGLIQVSTSGLAPTGVILGMGYNDLARAAGVLQNWFIIGTSVYFMTDAGVITSAGSITGTPTEPVQQVQKGSLTYISVPNDALYKLDHSAGTITAIATTNSPGLRAIAQYGERTLAGGPNGKAPDGSASPQNRVYYSAAGDPEDWDAATSTADVLPGFFDVGSTSLAITAIVPQKTFCTIITSDGSWWTLTGVPGVNSVLRKAKTSVSPAFPNHVVEIGSGDLAYTIASSTDNGSIASVGTFDGSSLNLVNWLKYGDGRLTSPYPTYQVVPRKNVDDFFITGGPNVAANSMVMCQYGSFTLHQWSVSGKTLYAFVNPNIVGDGFLLTDGGAVGVTPTFYTFRSYNNRPAFTSDPGAQPGDASTTPFSAYFTTPEWYDDKGREFRVTGVQVDFTSWNTGSPSTNHFDLILSTLRTWEDGTSRTHTTRTWDQAGSSSTTDIGGTRHRKRWEFADAKAGNGFNLKFDALRGVAIQKITVRIELDETTRF